MKKIIGIVLSSILVVSTVSIIGCDKEDKVSITNKEKLKNIKFPSEKDAFIDLDIYFNSARHDKKAEIVKEERLINKEELIGEIIVQELIKGPAVKSELKPILPKKTRLLSFSIKDGTAYVNLSSDAKVAMEEIIEEACLKCIASSLTQLPSVEKVKILIDNKDVDLLGGNYDISKPFNENEIDSLKK